jgi:hypothetical protein
MKVILRRSVLSNKAILGRLYFNGVGIAHTLENTYLDNQRNISAIPEGDYKVKKYSSAKYPDVWELQDVPNRSKILIHNGNIEEHTRGCILVGDSWGFLNDELAVLNSRHTLKNLREVLPDNFVIKIIR